jgi:hypothetical protein
LLLGVDAAYASNRGKEEAELGGDAVQREERPMMGEMAMWAEAWRVLDESGWSWRVAR